MTRRLIADHYYPNKLAEGRLDDIVPVPPAAPAPAFRQSAAW